MFARAIATAVGAAALLLSAPHGTVRVERFFSPAVGVEKHYLIYLPPSYATAPARRYPVAYYLHGLTENEADWVSLASIDVVADSLIAGGSPEMIVVMPDGDDGWYTNWEEAPQPYGACLVDTLLNRGVPALCVVQARYEDYIARDLVRHVDSTYRTLCDRRHRGPEHGGVRRRHDRARASRRILGGRESFGRAVAALRRAASVRGAGAL